jgi:hypothetical protein
MKNNRQQPAREAPMDKSNSNPKGGPRKKRKGKPSTKKK